MEMPPKKLFIPAPVPVPLLEAARALRKNMTDAEQLLWFCLRRKQLGGFRFRRQHPIEQYVLDFFVMKHGLPLNWMVDNTILLIFVRKIRCEPPF